MKRSLAAPIAGVALALAITTTMDATGLSAFSALPLFPLMAALALFERLSWSSLGFSWGRARAYALAIAYPVLVIGAVVLAAAVAGAIDLSHTDWRKAALNFALVSASTVVVAIVTEEGFFRGWLWASLARRGVGGTWLVVWTSLAFAMWHLSAATLKTGFAPPPGQVPVFMLNAAVIGAIWAVIRLEAGSIIVTSVSHGLWNGLAYVLFGFGTRLGALGIADTSILGPEVGALGLALNIVFLAVLTYWRWRARRGAVAGAEPRSQAARAGS